MTRVYIGMGGALLVADDATGEWQTETHFAGSSVEAVAVDPTDPRRVYIGLYSGQDMRGTVDRNTADGLRGLWRTDDAGATWHDVTAGLTETAVVSLAVRGEAGGFGTVYAGTEPSVLFRSADGGATWQPCTDMTTLPSAPEWAYPPRPYTHHVRQVGVDPTDAHRLYVCVENGAFIRSFDGGQTWHDRTPDAPHDTHTFATHPLAPGRLYSAAGDGFVRAGMGYHESRDYGDSWQPFAEGLAHHYLFGMAVDSQDPDTVLISASSSPDSAHNPTRAESYVYRRTAGGPWQQAMDGLPPAAGTVIAQFAAHPTRGGEFYAATNGGVFRSTNGGQSWQPLPVAWQPYYRYWHPNAVAVVE